MKKIVSLLISFCMCFSVIGIVPALAEETDAIGGTYTIYATNPRMATWAANATKPTFSTNSRWDAGYGIGTNSSTNCGPILRFTLPEIGENETVTSAKLVTTLAETSNMQSTSFTIRACTGFMDTEPDKAVSANDVGSFAEATATVSGQTSVEKTTVVGTKIEIDVTEYVKGLEAGTASADFLLAVTELTTATKNSHLKIYRPNAADEANRPVLVITTEESENLAKITSDNATAVPVNDYIAEIKFDRAMDPDTLISENITIMPDNIPIERVNYSSDYKGIKIAMGSNLLYNTEYTVSFSEDVLASDGKQLEEGTSFKFTTVSSDSGAQTPSLSSSSPKNGAKNVKAINSVSLRFSKEMYIPEISADDFDLTRSNGNAPDISSVSVHSDAKQVFVYFDEVLDYNESYTLNIDNICDLDGNEFSGSISFTTANASVVIKEVMECTAETKSEEQTVYTTSSGAEKTDADTIDKLYETSTYWGAGAEAAESQNNDTNNILPIGADTNGTKHWGSALRFKLPEMQENELVTDAKLVFTVKSTADHTGDIRINAYTGCLDSISHGSSIAKFGKTYEEVTACEVAGGISIPASSIVDNQKLEINVTEYIQSIASSATSADFVIAAPDMTSTNLVKLYSGHYSRVSYRPQLVLTTIPDTTAIGKTDVTLENMTDSEQEITLIAALYTNGEIFKDCIIKPDIKVGTGADKTIQVKIDKFANRSATDIIKVFGVESLETLVPLYSSYIGAVDAQFYPGYTRKAVTLSYDDGPSANDVTLLQRLNEKGVRATINNVGDRIKSGTTMQTSFDEAFFAGNHEMANHSYSHGMNLGKRETVEEAYAQMADGENALEYYYGTDVRGVAYPYGKPSQWFNSITQYLTSRQNLYARCSTNGTFDIPENFMEWDFTCHHDYLYSPTKDYANKFFNLLPDDGTLKVLSVWGHPYNYADSGTWDTILEPFASTIEEKSERGEVWNPTNIELVEYINAVNGLVINNDSIYNPSDVDVYVKINGVETIVPAGGTIY